MREWILKHNDGFVINIDSVLTIFWFIPEDGMSIMVKLFTPSWTFLLQINCYIYMFEKFITDHHPL